MRRVFFWFAFAALGVGLGCVGDPTASLTEGIGGVVTSVNKVTLNVGDSALVVAQLRSSQWTPVEEVPDVVSQTPAVATVSFADLPPLPQRRFYIKAVGFGEGTVVASGGGQSASVTVTTVPADVLVGGAPAELGSGATAQLAADPLDTQGNSITVPDSLFTWSSSPASVISISPTGLATAQAPGTATVTVTAPGGATGTASITVVAGVFAGTLSASSAAPGTVVTATKAAAGPDFDADSKARIATTAAFVDGFTAGTLTFAVPATGVAAATTLTLTDMGPNQLAQTTAFTTTAAFQDIYHATNTNATVSVQASAPEVSAIMTANNNVYFSHAGFGDGAASRGAWNGGAQVDHYFKVTTGASPVTVTMTLSWTDGSDVDLFILDEADNEVAFAFSGSTSNEILTYTFPANSVRYVAASMWTAGSNTTNFKFNFSGL